MDLRDRYFTVLDALPDHVFVFSESGVYIDVYGGEENATGFDCKAFIGLSLHDVSPPEMANQFHSYITAALDSGKTQIVKYKFDKQDMIDLPAHIPAPQEIWFEGTIKPLPLFENGERTVVWLAKNITQQHYLEQKLKLASETDELTGILNRRSFTESLSDHLHTFTRDLQTFSLLMLDIDRFKRINDSLGHSCGDETIKHVVKLLNAELSETDRFGRIGGEEFAILLAGTDEHQALLVAERLRKVLENAQCQFEDQIVKVTISIGVTQVNAQDSDIKSLLSRADKAMYHAKVSGRNQVALFTESLSQKQGNPSPLIS